MAEPLREALEKIQTILRDSGEKYWLEVDRTIAIAAVVDAALAAPVTEPPNLCSATQGYACGELREEWEPPTPPAESGAGHQCAACGHGRKYHISGGCVKIIGSRPSGYWRGEEEAVLCACKAHACPSPLSREEAERIALEVVTNYEYGALGEPRPRPGLVRMIADALQSVATEDTKLLDWLQEQVVNLIDLDDGRIIDVRGNSVRKALRAAMEGEKK